MSLKSSPNFIKDKEGHWIALSDLMTGLMMFFLLLSIAFMERVEADSDKIKKVAVLYDQLKTDLYIDLSNEFSSDLNNWGAEINKDLTIIFKEPNVLFNTGSDNLKEKFKTILDNFFPRYVKILSSDKYRNSITEIRIEGHTSSFWGANVSQDDAYFRNMELSQARTRTTLKYLLSMPVIQNEKPWLRQFLTANGLSSSKPIFENGKEDFARSQRVEFRVRTDAESRIANILEVSR